MARNYPDPWVPRAFSAWVVKASTTERVPGQVDRRTVPCWDVKGKADGVQLLKRLPRAALAQAWKERAERDFVGGLPFDLETKQFIVPPPPEGPTAPTVFALTELISATTTTAGLTIRAEADLTTYRTGIEVSDAELAPVPLSRHDFHGDWNYTIAQTKAR
jgi:hypothetical protein